MEQSVMHKQSLLRRFYTYQRERFPILGHGLLITVFTFSAISYSRLCRGETGFIGWKSFVLACFTTFTLFFLLRVLDEFKDKKEDALHRRHLPVPRGLISLRELGVIGLVVFSIQLLVNVLFAFEIVYLYGLVIVYLAIMSKEFLIADWLKRHPFWYVVSHMLIIPLVDTYASGFDWGTGGGSPPGGLLLFFAVSFMNGIVLEVGRKIKTPDKEEINTYSSRLGMKGATWLWLGVLTTTFVLSLWAASFVGSGHEYLMALSGVYVLCGLAGTVFLRKFTAQRARFIEHASALWTISMYLLLAGIPMLLKLVS